MATAEIMKDSIKKWERSNNGLWDEFGTEISFKTWSTIPENVMELSMTNPQLLFDELEKCYHDYNPIKKGGLISSGSCGSYAPDYFYSPDIILHNRPTFYDLVLSRTAFNAWKTCLLYKA